ncbi:hypothetical protein AAT18_00295 [Rhodococcus aetherivorans]|nr:hypothetical protein AAT18_00295 [Rhodococcus aetherivorans]
MRYSAVTRSRSLRCSRTPSPTISALGTRLVPTSPGQIALTPIPWPISSARRQSVNISTAALLVE